MGIDTKQLQADVAEGANTAADVAAGAAVTAVRAATDPIGSVRDGARRLARQGEPVNTDARRRARRTTTRAVNAIEETAGDLASGNLAQRVIERGLTIVKRRAERRDLVGDAAYRALNVVHGSISFASTSLTYWGNRTEPTRRSEINHGDARPAGRRRTTPSARRTSSRSAAGQARGGARTAARRAAAGTRSAVNRTADATDKAATETASATRRTTRRARTAAAKATS